MDSIAGIAHDCGYIGLENDKIRTSSMLQINGNEYVDQSHKEEHVPFDYG